jgi:hypothetical protein
MIDVPSAAYQEFSRGEISEDELHSLESFANDLSKTAATQVNIPGLNVPPPTGGPTPSLGREMGGLIGKGLMLGTAGLATSLLGSAAMSGAKAVHGKLTYRRDLNRLLDVRPEIKEEHSKRDIDLAFQSMRHLNPDLAKDPLTGSTLLQQILRNRDIHDPSAPPRMDLGVAKELYTAERRGRDPMQEMAARSFQAGSELAIRDNLEKARMREQMATRAQQEAERDTRRMTFDALRMGVDQDFRRQLQKDDQDFKQDLQKDQQIHQRSLAEDQQTWRADHAEGMAGRQEEFQKKQLRRQQTGQERIEELRASLMGITPQIRPDDVDLAELNRRRADMGLEPVPVGGYKVPGGRLWVKGRLRAKRAPALYRGRGQRKKP